MAKAGKGGALGFLEHEAAGGVLLLMVSILAVIAANTPLASIYSAFLDTPVVMQVGALKIAKPLLLWINDGLMAIFFFLVGMEIKRELIIGELSTRDRAILPAIAAAGGMAVPAFVYCAINWGDSFALRGWAIPAATDIAFAVAVIVSLGTRVPLSLKIFLLALAIIDDLGAILIIAFFYTEHLSVGALALAAAGIAVLAILNAWGVRRLSAFVVTGVFVWVCVLKSGVHATLAGVVLGLSIPLSRQKDDGGLLQRTEHAIHPWVTFGVLPVFAFANAGVSLAGLSLAKLGAGIPLGISMGLFIGKTIGITGAVWLSVKLGIASMPQGATWRQIVGMAMLGGIGFTMSLFIGTLAFPDGGNAADIRIGVIVGSLISAIAGYLVLSSSSPAVTDRKEA